MSAKVIAAVPVATNKLIVWFEGGESRTVESKDLDFGIEDDFGTFHIDADSSRITWNNGTSYEADELYAKGMDIDVVTREKNKLLKDLSRIRRDASFSQTRLGDAAGIRQSVISRIEGCEISPQINTLLKLLAPLGKTVTIVDLQDE